MNPTTWRRVHPCGTRCHRILIVFSFVTLQGVSIHHPRKNFGVLWEKCNKMRISFANYTQCLSSMVIMLVQRLPRLLTWDQETVFVKKILSSCKKWSCSTNLLVISLWTLLTEKLKNSPYLHMPNIKHFLKTCYSQYSSKNV